MKASIRYLAMVAWIVVARPGYSNQMTPPPEDFDC
jgi:hypothetical protein